MSTGSSAHSKHILARWYTPIIAAFQHNLGPSEGEGQGEGEGQDEDCLGIGPLLMFLAALVLAVTLWFASEFSQEGQFVRLRVVGNSSLLTCMWGIGLLALLRYVFYLIEGGAWHIFPCVGSSDGNTAETETAKDLEGAPQV
jgi:hypothetical protein